MANRATKSGINREVQAKMAAKYDAELAGQCMQWVKSKINDPDMNTSGDVDSVQQQLKNGQRLARLCNVVKPGSISENMISKATMTFKQMELINKFIDTCKSFGVPDHELFATVDLFENQNMNQFIVCLSAFMRKFGSGPKEATENKRHFTEEQLRQGESVIGLQMGTNKGASQAGMNIGKSRHIVD